MSKYKIFAFDMDGTLLDDQKHIPEQNLAALKKAAERGMLLVPASGRTVNGIPAEIREISHYAISINGAKLVDLKTGETLYRAEIDPELSLRILDYGKTLPVLYDCYQGDWGWMDAEMYDCLHLYIENPAMCAFARSVRTKLPDLYTYIKNKGESAQKFQFYFRDMELRRSEMHRMAEKFPELLITSSLSTNMEINAKNANKGAALAALCEVLGVDRECAAAIGDGSNDLTMIETAGLGIAMENSLPEILAAADVVTGNNNDAGLAQALERYILSC